MTSSKIIPFPQILEKKIKNITLKSKAALELNININKNFTVRFRNIQSGTKMAIATLLDPRYKKIHFTDDNWLNVAINSVTSEIQYHTDSNRENVSTILSTENQTNGDKDDFWDLYVKMFQSTTENLSYFFDFGIDTKKESIL